MHTCKRGLKDIDIFHHACYDCYGGGRVAGAHDSDAIQNPTSVTRARKATQVITGFVACPGAMSGRGTTDDRAILKDS